MVQNKSAHHGFWTIKCWSGKPRAAQFMSESTRATFCEEYAEAEMVRMTTSGRASRTLACEMLICTAKIVNAPAVAERPLQSMVLYSC